MKSKRAFTLVEIIVALAIFSIVAVVALGALVKIVSANKKAQTLQSAITNLNYALESISREMRVGSNYMCGTSYSGVSDTCSYSNSNGDVYITFKSSRRDDSDTCNLITAYKFSVDSGVEKWRQGECGDFPGNPSNFSSIIDENVTVQGYYVGLSEGTGIPLATIRISGYAGVRERERTDFDVQTSISPRIDSDE